MAVTRDETRNILEEGPLHKVMVFFQKAEALSWPFITLLQLISLLATGVVWGLLGSSPTVLAGAATVLGLATIADLIFLGWLPKARISFGPWKAQTVVLLIPRTAAACSMAAVASLVSWPVALFVHIVIQFLGIVLLWWGAAVETRRLALTHLTVRTSAMMPGTTPLKLLHISDIHLERLTAREEALLALAREAKPDLIVITGDFLNLSYNSDQLAKTQIAHLLEELEAPYGVYATLGSPPVDLRAEIAPVLKTLSLELLRDEWRAVEIDGDRCIVLMGVDCTHHLEQDAAQLAKVAATAPNGVPRILLYHSPELMPEAVDLGIDLYLCGHTHGGQVRLPGVGPILTSSQLGRRYVMGLYREGKTHLYVSRGVGLEGLSAPRVRFLSPPEITLVTLAPYHQSA